MQKHPHVRGEDRCLPGRERLPCGNPPTCVGKTARNLPGNRDDWKHPHVRGEDWLSDTLHCFLCRNTPTCVGKTKLGLHIFSTMRKHPHVRGEDGVPAAERPSRSETPPRAWGRPADGTTQVAASRNTPTCVGKTVIERFREPFPWKHPHVRGEDDPAPNHAFFKKETPPRAWGSPYRLARGTGTWGNTPTCVGKTQADSRRSQSVRKHPHVRGEDLPS